MDGRPFALRTNRVEDAETDEPRVKVLRINQKKNKLDGQGKEIMKPSVNGLGLKTLGQNGPHFFDRKEFDFSLVEKKPSQTLFSLKNDQGKVPKPNSVTKEAEKTVVINYKNTFFTKENGTFRKPDLRESKKEQPIKHLIEYEKDVMRYLLEKQSSYRLPPIPSNAKSSFQQSALAISTVCRKLKQRPETTISALYLLHFVSCHLAKKDILHYVVPCVTIASKSEEYYPPSIDELIHKFRYSTELSTVKGFEKVSKNQVIENEVALLIKLGFKSDSPPIMDIGNILQNSLGKFCIESKTSLFPYIESLILNADAFTCSLVTLAVSSMRLLEIIKDDYENIWSKTQNDSTNRIHEQARDHLDREFEYQLNCLDVGRLVFEAQHELDAPLHKVDPYVQYQKPVFQHPKFPFNNKC